MSGRGGGTNSEEVAQLDAINTKLASLMRSQKVLERKIDDLIDMQEHDNLAFRAPSRKTTLQNAVRSAGQDDFESLVNAAAVSSRRLVRNPTRALTRTRTIILSASPPDFQRDNEPAIELDLPRGVPSSGGRDRSLSNVSHFTELEPSRPETPHTPSRKASRQVSTGGGSPTMREVTFDSDAVEVDNFGLLPDGWPCSLKLRSGWTKALAESRLQMFDSSPGAGSKSNMLVATHELQVFYHDLPPPEEVPSKRASHLTALDPQSTVIVVWDVCCLLVLLYDLAFTPFMLAWARALTGYRYGVAWLTFCFWFVDLGMCLFTGYFLDGELHIVLKDVVLHYLRTWCALDVSILVLEFFSLLFAYKVHWGARALRVVALMRIPRLLRVAQRCFDRTFRLRTGLRVTIQCSALIVTVLWVTHMFCCLFFAVGRMSSSDTGSHWITPGAMTEESGLSYQYLTSYHWALQQMAAGTMDIHPTNSWERRLNIVCLLFGWLFGNSIVSILMIFVVEFHMARRERLDMLRRLNQYLQQNGIDSEMQLRVHKQVTEKLKEDRRLVEADVPGLALLSKNLRSELQSRMYRDHLCRYPLLQVWELSDPASLQRLCQHGCLYMACCSVAETIFHSGLDCNEAYFLVQGSVKYGQEPGTSMAKEFRVTNVEAEGQCICEAALFVAWTHVGTLVSGRQTEIMVIKVQEFLDCTASLRKVQPVTCEYARRFHHCLVDAKPPKADYPTDLEVPNTDFGELLLSMNARAQKDVSLYLLQTMQSSSWGPPLFRSRTDSEVSGLEAEVLDGKCLLTLSSNGEVERLVGITEVLLTNEQEKIFAQLGRMPLMSGKVLPWEVKAECRLPSMERVGNEVSEDCFQRFISEALGLPEGAVSDVSEHSKDTTRTWSNQNNRLCTRTVTTTHSAKLDERFTGDQACFTKCRYLSANDLFLVRDKVADSVAVCAWLPLTTFQHFRSPDGEADLHKRLMQHAKPLVPGGHCPASLRGDLSVFAPLLSEGTLVDSDLDLEDGFRNAIVVEY